jgi:hypothetical protein
VIYVRKNIKRADAFLESPWFDASERRRFSHGLTRIFTDNMCTAHQRLL